VDEVWFEVDEIRKRRVLWIRKNVDLVFPFHCHFAQLPQSHSHAILKSLRCFIIFLGFLYVTNINKQKLDSYTMREETKPLFLINTTMCNLLHNYGICKYLQG
jgi:hypothetical protein